MNHEPDIAGHRGPHDPPLPGLRVRARSALADEELQESLRKARRMFDAGRRIAESDPDLARLRSAGSEIRRRAVEDLGENLRVLEQNLAIAGFQNHHAADASEARKIICHIAQASQVRTVVKSKSMATEEIHLNDALESCGIKVIETDLGEFIVQQSGERPAHIIAPAIHKSRTQVRELFQDLTGSDPGERHEELTKAARKLLREEFIAADMGITGVNFAAADSGTLALVSNEGNLRMTTTLPRIHVALMPIEKVVGNFEDLATLLPLLVRSATGQRLSSYVSLLSSPKRPGELDGPDESHVVFLDAGRRNLSGGDYEPILRCIRCAACLTVCPVYTKVGGHFYGGAYSGPMGAVLAPLIEDDAAQDLPFASTLCGACTDACPVGIPLHELLYSLRARQQRSRPSGPLASGLAAWSAAWSKRSGYRISSAVTSLAGKLADAAAAAGITSIDVGNAGETWLSALPGSARQVSDGRAVPIPAAETFQQWWRKNRPSDSPEDAIGQSAEPETHPETSSGDAPGSPAPAGAHQAEPDDVIAEFTVRLRSNGIEVFDARAGNVPEVVADLVGTQSVVYDVEDDIMPIVERMRESGTDCRPADLRSATTADFGLALAIAGIADTGSVAVRTNRTSSRMTSLLPPASIICVNADVVYPTIEAVLTQIINEGLPSGLVLISGPSKTADIELVLTTGVHGPGDVKVIIT